MLSNFYQYNCFEILYLQVFGNVVYHKDGELIDSGSRQSTRALIGPNPTIIGGNIHNETSVFRWCHYHATRSSSPPTPVIISTILDTRSSITVWCSS
jgi:hypothetical protein